MRTATYLRTRVDPGPSTLAVTLGDAVAIVAFVTVGVVQHGGDPVGDPARVVGSAAPFLLSWALVAFLGGLFTSDAVASPRRAVSWAVPAWVLATLLGHAIRASPIAPGGTTIEFVLVTLAIGGLLVVGWRLVASLFVDRL